MTAKLAEMATTNHPRRSLRAANTRVPTPQEVRAAREAARLTIAEAAAKVLGSSSAWEKWESMSASENRRMHPGLYKLFLITTCQAVPDWLKVDGEPSA